MSTHLVLVMKDRTFICSVNVIKSFHFQVKIAHEIKTDYSAF